MVELPRLRKAWPPRWDIGDGGEIVHRYSANWEISDLPGLFLCKGRGPQDERAEWYFSCAARHLPPERHPQEFQSAIALFPLLEGQRFSTRQEALQALAAIINLQEARE